MKQDLLNRLAKHLESFPPQINKLKKEEVLAKPRPEKWSKQEILGHLVDSAKRNLIRFEEIKFAEDSYEFSPYQQDQLVVLNDYQNKNFKDVLSLWSGLNEQILTVWKAYSPLDLDKQVLIPHVNQSGTTTWWMEDYLDHMEQHFKQVFELDA